MSYVGGHNRGERGKIGPKMDKIGSFLQFLAIFEALMTFSLLMLFDDTRYCFSVIFLRKKLSRINQSGGHSRGSKGSNWTKNGVNWLNTRRFNLESTLNYSKDTNNQYRVHL